jgi:hypothetical protein
MRREREDRVNMDRVIGRANYLVLPALCLAAFGCAGNTASPVDARAAGEWTFRLPETQSPYAGLAIDRGGPAIAQNDHAKSVLDDSDVTTPSTELAVAPASKSKAQPKARMLVANARAEKPSMPEATAPPATTPEVKVVEPEQLAVQLPATTSNDAERYSGREAKSEKQRDYRGGDAIVISASALVIILLVVVLILLLT